MDNSLLAVRDINHKSIVVEPILSKFVGNFPFCFPERSHRKDLLFHYRHIVIYSGMRIIFSSTDKSFAQIIYLSCTFV